MIVGPLPIVVVVAVEAPEDVRTIERKVTQLITGNPNAESRAFTVELGGVRRVVYTEAAPEVGVHSLAGLSVGTVQVLVVAADVIGWVNVEPSFHIAFIVIEAPDVGDTPVTPIVVSTPADVAVNLFLSERRGRGDQNDKHCR